MKSRLIKIRLALEEAASSIGGEWCAHGGKCSARKECYASEQHKAIASLDKIIDDLEDEININPTSI